MLVLANAHAQLEFDHELEKYDLVKTINASSFNAIFTTYLIGARPAGWGHVEFIIKAVNENNTREQILYHGRAAELPALIFSHDSFVAKITYLHQNADGGYSQEIENKAWEWSPTKGIFVRTKS